MFPSLIRDTEHQKHLVGITEYEKQSQKICVSDLNLSLVAFFVMNFAQITSSPTSTFLNTVFLHKRKNTTKNGGCGEVVESGMITDAQLLA